MKNFIVGLCLALALSLGLYNLTRHASITNVTKQEVGASPSPDHYNFEQFFSGIGFGTAAKSSSTPAAIGTSPSFFMTASSSAQTASSSLIRSTSQLYITYDSSSPVTGVACSSALPTTTKISYFSSSTAPSQNGFIITTVPGPASGANPYCLHGFIIP